MTLSLSLSSDSRRRRRSIKTAGEKKLKFYENKNNKKMLEKVKTTSNINEMREKRKLNLHESNFKV
jgi:hypothetical protein